LSFWLQAKWSRTVNQQQRVKNGVNNIQLGASKQERIIPWCEDGQEAPQSA